MKKRLYLLLIIVLNSLCISAEVRVETMETYEFLAALSRVAGYPEFCQENSSYAQEIDSWFQQYKNHETVEYHKNLRTTHNIMYDAIATMGVHLTIENGALVLIPNTKIEETRWAGVNINEAVSKYNQYYQETNFHELYMAHKDEFEGVINDYRNRVLPYFDEGWYNAFYGVEAKDNFWVVIGFNNGYHNYGVSRQIADNKRDVFNVGRYDRNNDPASSSSTLIHEFNHSFVNPLLEETTNYNMMKDNGSRLFELSYLAMAKAQAYGIWIGVINESVVRAGVIIYMLEHNYTKKVIGDDILNNVACGFTWIPELVEKMRYYKSHRDEFITLNDFYPEINKCFEEYIEQIEARIKDCTKIQDGTSLTINNDEFSHSAVDPLLNNSTNYNLIKDYGQWLYKLSRLDMQYQSFDNWQAVFNESVVKAGAIVSMLKNNESSTKINDAIVDGISKGFTWMPELVGILVYYASHHDKYATLNDFFPDIAQCINDYVKNVLNKMDSCTGFPPKESLEKTIDGVLFKFETNQDSPTTLTLVGIGQLNGNPLTIPATVDGMAVKSIGEEVFYQNSKISKVIIPEGVERIERNAFNRSSLQEVELPSTLKTIGYGAFALCNLTSFHIPTSVNTLDYQCIANNMISSLTVDENNPIFDSRDNCNAVIETATNTLVHATLSTVIPKSVTAIGEQGYNSLQRMTSVKIPSWITSIGNRAFSYCKNLETIYCEIETPFPIGEETFLWATEATLFVPYGSKELYRSTEGWKNFTNIVEMDEKESITISGAKQVTYMSDKNLNFTDYPDLKAYVATGYDKASGTIWLTRVKEVPANTGFLLMGDAGDYEIPVKKGDPTSYYMNLFKGTIEGTTIQTTDGDYTNYYLSNGDSGVGFYKVQGSVTLKANRAYLSVPTEIPAVGSGGNTETIKVSSAGQVPYYNSQSLDFSSLDAQGVKAYTATGYDYSSGTIWLTRVKQVPAETGILIMAPQGEYPVPTASVASVYANMFKGTLTGTTIQTHETIAGEDYINYYLSSGDAGVGFYRVTKAEGVTIGANRCYLPIKNKEAAGTRSANSGQNQIAFQEADEVIGIPLFRGIDGDEDGTTNLTPALSKGEGEGEWYTLQGQRVAKPSKGVYIKNGKKVVIK